MATTTSPPSDAQRPSQTYTPPSSPPLTRPSADEPGPVEEEDDIPREDNDTPRE